MLSAAVYYLLTASSVLFYGIGLSKTVSHSDSLSQSMLTCFKSLFSAGSATAVSYLLINWLLVPVQLVEIFPFLAALIFILTSTLTEIFIGVGSGQSPVDFSIPLLSVFLGLNEGLSLGLAVTIACMSIISFYCVLIVFHCVRKRVGFHASGGGLGVCAVLLLSLALVMMAIYGLNVSWLNVYPGGGVE